MVLNNGLMCVISLRAIDSWRALGQVLTGKSDSIVSIG